MGIEAVLFDLDGTLLPMDQDVFVKVYMKLLAAKMAARGYDPGTLLTALGKGAAAVVQNDGSCTNKTRFWQVMTDLLGENIRREEPALLEFYANEFQQVAAVCGKNPAAREAVELLKEKGLRRILATNPLFPPVATCSRIRWAGLEPEDFELVTTYDNSSFCKPNPDYFREIMEKQNLSGENCLMVGNDTWEDTVAAQTGMQVFLLTDCLINRDGRDLAGYPHGGFRELLQLLRAL